MQEAVAPAPSVPPCEEGARQSTNPFELCLGEEQGGELQGLPGGLLGRGDIIKGIALLGKVTWAESGHWGWYLF
jgi:hypothetical protein